MPGKNLTEVAPISVELNAKMVTQALKVVTSEPLDYYDNEAFTQRVFSYFNDCIEKGLRPGNMGLYAALGLTRQDVNNALTGKSRKLSPACIDTLQKSLLALSQYREQLGANGRLNPVTLIFWQKNFDGLRDERTLEVDRRFDTQQAQMTPEEIARQIEADIPIDFLPEPEDGLALIDTPLNNETERG